MPTQEKQSRVPSFLLGAVVGLSVGLVILAAKCPPVPAPAGQPAPAPARPVDGPAMHTPASPAKAEEPAK